jgi:hypothetical protein
VTIIALPDNLFLKKSIFSQRKKHLPLRGNSLFRHFLARIIAKGGTNTKTIDDLVKILEVPVGIFLTGLKRQVVIQLQIIGGLPQYMVMYM